MKHLFSIILLAICLFTSCSTSVEEKQPGIFEGKPRINPPYIVGNYPGTPFLFYIPTAGERPVSWQAEELPKGLTLDSQTGIISGEVAEEGIYKVKLTAKNRLGSNSQELLINIGDKLALTPTMGWNSWNTFGQHLTESLIMETAEAMIKNGMRELGYAYINIDDFWQLAERGKDGYIQINKEKFPNGIKHVADYLHARGFKLGIYSDAAERTCGGVCGSYGYEEVDVKDFAAWGVDLLKYDYCNAPSDKAVAIERYTAMGKALKNSGRSIIYNVCEWGQLEPWIWAKEAGAHYWRTTFDIRPTWKAKEYSYMDNGILDILDLNAPLAGYAAPGAWNDPDMLVVGMKKDSHLMHDREPGSAGLTPEQDRSHVSMWAMLAAPLLCGNDVRNMDSVTIATLTNPEIIAIGQDMAGKQAVRVKRTDELQVWTKPLSDGSLVVACLNATGGKVDTEINSELVPEIGTARAIRDVWGQKEIVANKNVLIMTLNPFECKVLVVKRR